MHFIHSAVCTLRAKAYRYRYRQGKANCWHLCKNHQLSFCRHIFSLYIFLYEVEKYDIDRIISAYFLKIYSQVRYIDKIHFQTTMTITSVGVFTECESEQKQLFELRQYYNERGAGIDRTGSWFCIIKLNGKNQGPKEIFPSLKELLLVSKTILTKMTSEKEVELLLNSLFSLFISFKEEQLAELVQLYCQLLTSEIFRGYGWNSLVH